jgi:photosystem II stability/assembly factor-like uncharacterized protein
VWGTWDGGSNWWPLTDTQSTLFMGSIALAPSDPNVIYAGTGEANLGPSKARIFRSNIYPGQGVLKSTDGGATWNLLGTAEFNRRTIAKVVVAVDDPNTVYVAVGAQATDGLAGNTGVWKSTDGGGTWNRLLADSIRLGDDDAVSDLAMDPTNAQVLYAAVGNPRGSAVNGIYKTTDGGATWARAGNFPTGAEDPRLGRMTLALAASDPQVLYVAIAASGRGGLTAGAVVTLYKTMDGGQSWTALDRNALATCSSTGGRRVEYMAIAGDYQNSLGVDPADPNRVYAAGKCLIRTTNGGQTWTNIADGQRSGPHHDHHAASFDAFGRLLDGNDGGVWRLDNNSPVTWANLNGNLASVQFNSLALHPTDANIAYGGTQDNGVVKFQDDPAWARLTRDDAGAVVVDSSNPETVYGTAEATVADLIKRSDDGGQTWVTRVDGIDLADPKLAYPPLIISPTNPSRLLFGTNRVYETTNRADLWRPISTPGQAGWTGSDRIDALALAPSNANRIYATANGRIYTTADRGASWAERDIPGATDHLAALVVNEVNSQIVYAVRDRFGGGHVFRSDDAGQNWNDISGDLPDVPVYTLALDRRFSPRRLYIGTSTGVFASDNGGGHWYPLAAGLPNVQVVQLELNTTLNILAAATHGRGVWQLLVAPPPGPRPGTEHDEALPASFLAPAAFLSEMRPDLDGLVPSRSVEKEPTVATPDDAIPGFDPMLGKAPTEARQQRSAATRSLATTSLDSVFADLLGMNFLDLPATADAYLT